VNRSTASRSEHPSIRCNTITTATIIGGTLRRPTSQNRSENISSGNRSKHSRCNSPKIESGATLPSQKVVVVNTSAWVGVNPKLIPSSMA
jgi:hypothetical protein